MLQISKHILFSLADLILSAVLFYDINECFEVVVFLANTIFCNVIQNANCE